ncbi:rhomboid family intramembrane serine protease [Treponema phagedenis]|uniref:rhomboid family intramembrane serine protease n=1 Tax=Treponema phagedenis TaxID=162 RepID=UPI0001F641FF|nr:rhomboid family intramembrane serine protease [Treponema phagedenis]EFW39323.1 peptidase, S54 family [Treponema phagedenis F0421]NVP24621.1 rhomboid family intramembrane serine protease [Treponema phagedenis]QKS91918.1 rhomboid family intramembrane serine protease [Treponema phagedenis]QLC58819.1 rhomboid family intramembrane serine protease [Treponema phagedenis]TYT79429.1 rhomboid family intramembrane serine protease [Treponema phagedenis]
MKFLRKPFKYVYWNAGFTLILINTIVFALTSLFKTLTPYLALIPLYVTHGHMYWQIFTYQFVHGGFWHLLFNMLGILFFGVTVEKQMGSKEFLLFYLLTGTLCGLSSYFIYSFVGFQMIALVGASGAIFAVLFLFAVMFPNAQIFLWGIIPIPAPILIIGFALFEIFDLLFSSDNVAHLVHLLGFFFAWLYMRIRFGIKPLKVWNIIR